MTTGALDIQANSTQGPPSDIGPTGGDPPAHGGVIGTGLLEPGRAAWPHGSFESRPGHWPQPYQRCPAARRSTGSGSAPEHRPWPGCPQVPTQSTRTAHCSRDLRPAADTIRRDRQQTAHVRGQPAPGVEPSRCARGPSRCGKRPERDQTCTGQPCDQQRHDASGARARPHRVSYPPAHADGRRGSGGRAEEDGDGADRLVTEQCHGGWAAGGGSRRADRGRRRGLREGGDRLPPRVAGAVCAVHLQPSRWARRGTGRC